MRRAFISIAEGIGVDEKTVRNVFRDYVNEMEVAFRFETPQWMGIAEINLLRPRCVISHSRNNTIVDLLRDRNKKTAVNGHLSLPAGRSARGSVCRDG